MKGIAQVLVIGSVLSAAGAAGAEDVAGLVKLMSVSTSCPKGSPDHTFSFENTVTINDKYLDIHLTSTTYKDLDGALKSKVIHADALLEIQKLDVTKGSFFNTPVVEIKCKASQSCLESTIGALYEDIATSGFMVTCDDKSSDDFIFAFKALANIFSENRQ